MCFELGTFERRRLGSLSISVALGGAFTGAERHLGSSVRQRNLAS